MEQGYLVSAARRFVAARAAAWRAAGTAATAFGLLGAVAPAQAQGGTVPSGPAYTITDLGVLGTPDPFGLDPGNSAAFGLNAGGAVVGISSAADSNQHAVLWQGGKTDLGVLGMEFLSGQFASAAYGINSAGQIVGTSTTSNGWRAVSWRNGLPTMLSVLGTDLFGWADSGAYSINTAGQIVGYSTTAAGANRAVLWQNGVITNLGLLGGAVNGYSSAYAINTAGQIAGYSSTTTGAYHAVLWPSAGTMTDLDPLAPSDSVATALNDAGQVVGYAFGAAGSEYAALWQNGRRTDLGVLGTNGAGASFSGAMGINGAGQIVGYSSTSVGGGQHAVLWQAGGAQPLDLNHKIAPEAGWELIQANAINTAGQIAGKGTLNGVVHGFLLTPVPGTGPAVPAVATNDTYAVDEDTALRVGAPGVLANDTGVTGATVVASPANGTLVLSADGSFTYSPRPNFSGADQFTYQASGANGALSNVATVTLTVNPINDAPVAQNDAATTPEDTAVAISVLGNDSDVDGDALALDSVTAAANGSVTISGDKKQAIYSPRANYFGTDQFSYTVSDGRGGRATATVTVTVTPVNDAPVASGQAITTTEDTSVAITLSASDVDGDALTYTIVSGPARGTLSGTGASRTYTPAPNYYGPDSFTFKANDGKADSNTATVTITVTPVNDAPVAADNNYSVAAGTVLTVAAPGVLGNDSDPDGDPMTAQLVAGPTSGTLTLNANGSFTYIPNANFAGTDRFTYRASDGQAASNVATVTLTVVGNRPPVAVNDSASTKSGTPVTITVLGNDSDPDGDPLRVTAVSAPANGQAVINSNNSVTYTSSAGFVGTDTFTYSITDGRGGTSTATVSVTVAKQPGGGPKK